MNDELVLCFPEEYIPEPDDTICTYSFYDMLITNYNPKTLKNAPFYDSLLNSFYRKEYVTFRDLGDPDIYHPLTKCIGASFIPRSIVEDKTYFTKQAIVAVLISNMDGIYLMKCLEGDMAGKYTMVEGHVAIPMDKNMYTELEKVQLVDFREFIDMNAIRELDEEVKVEGCNMTNLLGLSLTPSMLRFGPKWFTHTNVKVGVDNISAKHVGFIYELYMDHQFSDIGITLSSNESCNELIYVKYDDIDKEFLSKCDTWLQDIIRLKADSNIELEERIK